MFVLMAMLSACRGEEPAVGTPFTAPAVPALREQIARLCVNPPTSLLPGSRVPTEVIDPDGVVNTVQSRGKCSVSMSYYPRDLSIRFIHFGASTRDMREYLPFIRDTLRPLVKPRFQRYLDEVLDNFGADKRISHFISGAGSFTYRCDSIVDGDYRLTTFDLSIGTH